MKKINRLAAAMAVALSMTAVPQANAEIEFHPNGRGDALLFPVFNGYVENYFTIMNNHDKWIQGHLRFRGGAWSGELRDMDIILSPGDVFVFRVADVDGDGMWEIDQSLDIKNFQYTGLGGTPEKGGMDSWFRCKRENVEDDEGIPQCIDPSDALIPTADELARGINGIPADVTPTTAQRSDARAIIDYHRHMGYVEFIGEAVLDGMDHNIMQILLGPNPGAWKPYQTTAFSQRGTSAWAWSDAANKFATDRRQIVADPNKPKTGLSDVPNALSGTAFITIPGVGHGLAYNAEALVNFRTGETDHRVDNYRVKCDAAGQKATCTLLDGMGTAATMANRAVILHNDDGASNGAATPFKPFGDYVYRFGTSEDRLDEARISFNNTWGPTLADGDDYDISGLRNSDTDLDDDFDSSAVSSHGLDYPNSIAEVEEAIRLGVSKHPPAVPGPQVFTAYYMDGDVFDKSCEGLDYGTQYYQSFCPKRESRAKPAAGATTLTTLTSYYLAFFPTKFYYGESASFYSTATLRAYMVRAVTELLRLSKPVSLQVWDIFENTTGVAAATASGGISPVVESTVAGPTGVTFGHELTFLNIEDIKKFVGGGDNFLSGRVVVQFPINSAKTTNVADYQRSWPGLMYTFEWDGGANLAHWRPMHRMHQ